MNEVTQKQAGGSLLGSMSDMAHIAQVAETEPLASLSAAGMIAASGPGTIALQTEHASELAVFQLTDATAYVGADGIPIEPAGVKAGLSAMICYHQVGDQRLASRIVVNPCAALV